MKKMVGWAVLILAIPVGGCSKPLIPGPQLTHAPPGFAFDASATQARQVFPDREITDERGYFLMRADDDHCSIMITAFRGAAAYESVLAARNALEVAYGHAEYGPMESLKIAGRPAWGWRAMQYVEGSLAALEYTAVVPFARDDVTYTLQFYASVPEYMDEAFMKKTLASFRVKGTTMSLGKIGVTLALAAGFALAYRRHRDSLA